MYPPGPFVRKGHHMLVSKPQKRRSTGELEEVVSALVFMVSILLQLQKNEIPEEDAEGFGHCDAIISKYLKRRLAERAFNNG